MSSNIHAVTIVWVRMAFEEPRTGADRKSSKLLVALTSGTVMIGVYDSQRKYFYFGSDRRASDYDVTFWAYLPEAPR